MNSFTKRAKIKLSYVYDKIRDRKVMRIAGPPRSGTNLLRYLLDDEKRLDMRFDHIWWKHSPRIQPDKKVDKVEQETCSAILFKTPESQLVSWYNEIIRSPKLLISEARNFEQFITSPLAVNLRRSSKMRYDSPLSYFRQYYFSYLESKSNFVFVSYDQLKADPLSYKPILEELSGLDNIRIRNASPENYLSRNSDGNWKTSQHVTNKSFSEASTDKKFSIDDVDQASRDIINDQLAEIWNILQNK